MVKWQKNKVFAKIIVKWIPNNCKRKDRKNRDRSLKKFLECRNKFILLLDNLYESEKPLSICFSDVFAKEKNEFWSDKENVVIVVVVVVKKPILKCRAQSGVRIGPSEPSSGSLAKKSEPEISEKFILERTLPRARIAVKVERDSQPKGERKKKKKKTKKSDFLNFSSGTSGFYRVCHGFRLLLSLFWLGPCVPS